MYASCIDSLQQTMPHTGLAAVVGAHDVVDDGVGLKNTRRQYWCFRSYIIYLIPQFMLPQSSPPKYHRPH